MRIPDGAIRLAVIEDCIVKARKMTASLSNIALSIGALPNNLIGHPLVTEYIVQDGFSIMGNVPIEMYVNATLLAKKFPKQGSGSINQRR
jgi:hypothetical protein